MESLSLDLLKELCDVIQTHKLLLLIRKWLSLYPAHMTVVRIKEMMNVNVLAQSLENSSCLINAHFLLISSGIPNHGALALINSPGHLIHVKYVVC